MRTLLEITALAAALGACGGGGKGPESAATGGSAQAGSAQMGGGGSTQTGGGSGGGSANGGSAGNRPMPPVKVNDCSGLAAPGVFEEITPAEVKVTLGEKTSDGQV